MYLRVPATILESRFFDNLPFFNFTAVEMSREGNFGLKIAIFCQKSPNRQNLEINKNHLNTPNCQILDHLKHFYQKMGILGHFWPY